DSTIDVISRVSSSIYKASSNVETVAEDVDGVVAFNQEVLEEIEYVTIVSIQNEEAAAKIEDITSQMHTNALELEGLMKGFNVEIKEEVEVVTNNKNQENDVSFDLDGDDDFIMFD
ncbi:MAG: hypothetical protein U9O86_03140, partial [Campylobacterota bacterium]|nr:hypothetical protein [Campylobacterota bacterium]